MSRSRKQRKRDEQDMEKRVAAPRRVPRGLVRNEAAAKLYASGTTDQGGSEEKCILDTDWPDCSDAARSEACWRGFPLPSSALRENDVATFMAATKPDRTRLRTVSNASIVSRGENEVANQAFFPINRPTEVSAILASRMRFAETQFDRPLACRLPQVAFRNVSR